MDLRGTTILNKNPEALSWKSFHEFHFKYYYTQLPSMLLFAHLFFMNNTFSYLRTNLFFTLPFFPLFFPPKHKILFFPLGTSPRPLLELASLSNGSWKSFPPINDPLNLHEPMRIKNEFSFQWK
jgi:hypothetical protein